MSISKRNNRTIPHEFHEDMAQYMLESLAEDIQANTQRFLSGKLDNNLPVIFNSLAQKTAELACLRFFYAESPIDEVLGLFGQSSQAVANMFRLIGTENKQISIEWDGNERSVASQAHMDMQNSIKVEFGLRTATIAGRNDVSEYLGRLQQGSYVHPAVICSDFSLQFTRFLQLLALGDDENATLLKGYLLENVSKAYGSKTPDAMSLAATCKAYLAILDNDVRKMGVSLDNLVGKHRELFDSDRNNMRGRILGLVSLEGLAIYRLARKRGMNVNIDNNYLPTELLKIPVAPIEI